MNTQVKQVKPIVREFCYDGFRDNGKQWRFWFEGYHGFTYQEAWGNFVTARDASGWKGVQS